MSERCERCQAEGATQRYPGCGGFYCELHHEANRVMCTSVDDGRTMLSKLSDQAVEEVLRLDNRRSVRLEAARVIKRRLKDRRKGAR